MAISSYQPTPVPNDAPQGLKAYLANELRKIASVLSNRLQLPILGAEPEKIEEGMIVFADGTAWNPGSGRGFYGYRSGAWRKLD